MRMKRRSVVALLAAGLVATMVGVAVSAVDFGTQRDNLLRSESSTLFGVQGALKASSTVSANPAAASVDARKLVTLAKGLTAHVVTQGEAAPNVDMIALWPNDVHPTHLVYCNEQEETDPGVQRLDLATGDVATIVTGTVDCDPAHVTPWGTVIFGEEAGGGSAGGRVYEMIDPLHTTGVSLDRATGVFSGGQGASNIVPRPALGRNSFEGIGILPNGVTYVGDENRPSSGTPGGSYFKFVPSVLRNPDAGSIANLSQSPLASGSVYGLRLGKRGTAPGTDYGQGTEFGMGTWVPLPAGPEPDLRAATASLKLTGYYRPEDLSFDERALAQGKVRFCGNNTGNESEDHLWGNTVCITDGTVAQAGTNTATPEVQLLVQGNPEFAMMDNVAYQPGRGNWVIHEDGSSSVTGRNNDLWDCLPDGVDDDTLSDGCIRVGTINDLGPAGAPNEGDPAEWTGGVFDASGKHLYVSIQHNMTGFGVILDITGWK